MGNDIKQEITLCNVQFPPFLNKHIIIMVTILVLKEGNYEFEGYIYCSKSSVTSHVHCQDATP